MRIKLIDRKGFVKTLPWSCPVDALPNPFRYVDRNIVELAIFKPEDAPVGVPVNTYLTFELETITKTHATYREVPWRR